jgi:hypothetical protein
VQDDIAHDNSDHRSAIRRELHYFTLYRILEAALLCLVVFSPVGLLIGKPDAPTRCWRCMPCPRPAPALQ